MTGALWITAERPDPRLSGGNIRQHHMLTALAAAMPTDLLLVGDSLDDAPVRAALRRVVEIPTSPRLLPRGRLGAWALNLYLAMGGGPWEVYIHRPTLRQIARFLEARDESWDVIVVEHGFLAPAGRAVRRTEARTVITLHNLASEAALQQMRVQRSSRRRWLARRAASSWRRLEQQAVRDFDVVVTVSQPDTDALGACAVLVPNGVDCTRFSDAAPRTGQDVLFLGHLNFPPNSDGLTWFGADIWPRVRAALPEARLNVVGRDPNAEVRAAVDAMPGASLHPDVPAVDPYLGSAAVSVVPLRFGTGTRLKALESLAAGVPLVGTTIGLEGLGIVDGVHALVRDSPAEFAAALGELLADPSLSSQLAREGQALARSRFDWPALTAAFVAAVTAPKP